MEKSELEPFPYAADHELIFERLGSELGEVVIGWARAWFPMSEDGEVLEEHFPGREGVSLVPWLVPVVQLDLGVHGRLIAEWSEKEDLADDFVAGTELLYWEVLVRFASSVLADFRIRKRAVLEPGRIRMGWQTSLTRRERAALRSEYLGFPSPYTHIFSPPTVEELTHRYSLSGDLTILDDYVDAIVRRAEELITEDESFELPKESNPLEDWLDVLKRIPGFVSDGLRISAAPEDLKGWRNKIRSAGYTAVRPGLILSEPGKWSPQGRWLSSGFEDSWRLVLYVESEEDPSYRLPLPHALRDRGGIGRTLNLAGPGAERLLHELFSPTGAYGGGGYARGHPGEFFLTDSEAGYFLKYIVPRLRHLGFDLNLPKWYKGPEDIQEVTLRGHVTEARGKSASAFSLERLLEFRWEVAVGGKPLSPVEIRRLIQVGPGLVRLPRGLVYLKHEDVEALQPIVDRGLKSKVKVRDAMRYALLRELSVDGIPVQEVSFKGRISELVGRLQEKREFQILPQPKGFVGELRPYQVRGFSWLVFMTESGLGACLADDMGLGKTIQTLALLQHRWEQGKRRPVLLVCPTSVVQNWKKEAQRFTPDLPVLIHHGSDRDRTEAFVETASKQALVVSSYSLLHRDQRLLKKVDWAGVVLDEAQNIKNPNTKQARAARKLEGDFRLALTGTPVENNVGELWSIMEFLNPGWLGSHRSFRMNFWRPIEKKGDKKAADRLRRLVRPFILRREKTDKSIISDLPEKLEMKVYCNLTKEQGALYETVLRDLERRLDESSGMKRRGVILAALTRLKQICNHPAQFLRDDSTLDGRSGKLTRLVEMLDEILTVGDSALVFTQFAEMGQMLQKYLSETFGKEVLYLHGGVPRKRRDKMIAAFQKKNGPPIFVLSLKAGGLGVNLTRASHVFHFDRWWNPAVENQATDRAFRIGQSKNVQVHKFICVGTLEESIDEMIERKKKLADRIVGTGEAWLTELSNEEIRKLLALRPDAVGE